ncbi:MAG: hypothetical protein K9K67_08995 [Bacteriovoracaceae bacterium]|nr:hypothetical protein [Bacteriovoracaceae bacterium]
MNFKSLIACASLFATGQSMAFNVWNGSKTLASFESKGTLVYQVDLNDKHGTAIVADYNGAGYGSFKEDGDKLIINLRKPIINIGWPIIFNPYSQVMEQVYAEFKINEMALTEIGTDTYEIEENSTACYTFRVPGEQDRVDCKAESKLFPEQYTKLDQPRKMKTRIAVGDKVVLPSTGLEVAYVEVLEGNKVKDLSPRDVEPAMETLTQKDGALKATFMDGSFTVFSRLAEHAGYELLIAQKFDGTGQLAGLGQGIIVKDENVLTAALDLSGTYNSISFGIGTYYGDEFLLRFNENGFGGFTSYDAYSDTSSDVVWNWSQNASGIEATRWMPKDRSFGFFNTEEEIQQCIDGILDCYPAQKRDYKVIAKDNNKVVVFRTMKMNLNWDNGGEYRTSNAVQILYRK